MSFRILLNLTALFTLTSALYAEDTPVRVYIPFVLHSPVLAADGSVAWALDGSNKPVNGNQQPLFDTLIGIANPTDQAVNVRFSFFDTLGRPQYWGDGRPHRDYVLQPNRSVATTLIPYNVFPDPPQNFIGYGILELNNLSGSGVVPALPVYALIGGGGFFPNHWNTFSATVPVYSRNVPARNKWLFPYLIPFFEDVNHFHTAAYRTGMVITNFDEKPVEILLTYRVSDFYPRAGEVVSFMRTIPARQSIILDLYDELLKGGYRESMNSEGWLQVESRLPAMIVPYLLHANRSYDQFSAGQGAISCEGL
jgi:hypothetical protein